MDGQDRVIGMMMLSSRARRARLPGARRSAYPAPRMKVDGRDLITNEMIDEITRFDGAAIVAEATAHRPGR